MIDAATVVSGISQSNSIVIPIDATQGKVRFKVDETAEGPFRISADLLQDAQVITSSALDLAEEGLTYIEPAGGEATGLGGRVKVTFPEGAANRALAVRIRPARSSTRPSYSLSGQPFEITAKERDTGNGVDRFQKSLTIEITYAEEQLWGDERGLALFYYDKQAREWKSLPSQVDTVANRLTAASDHLTLLDLDIQSWQSSRLPSLEAFQVSSFSGAATYGFPFWTPPGPAGLQPSISLYYNSQAVDSATALTQASWVGMGWSLDTGYIERNLAE